VGAGAAAVSAFLAAGFLAAGAAAAGTGVGAATGATVSSFLATFLVCLAAVEAEELIILEAVEEFMANIRTI
jgi:hypothetical protein